MKNPSMLSIEYPRIASSCWAGESLVVAAGHGWRPVAGDAGNWATLKIVEDPVTFDPARFDHLRSLAYWLATACQSGSGLRASCEVFRKEMRPQ